MEHVQLLPLAVLATLAACALVHDALFRRIPNGLVLAGMALGLVFQTYASDGEGLFCGGHGLGYWSALLGALTGLGLFLPLYALRVMGAGDVKLVAMIGVWLGPQSTAWAVLWTLLAGGVLSIVAAFWAGVWRRVLVNLHVMVATGSLMPIHGQDGADDAPTATGRLPYALAVTAGMVIELVRLGTA